MHCCFLSPDPKSLFHSPSHHLSLNPFLSQAKGQSSSLRDSRDPVSTITHSFLDATSFGISLPFVSLYSLIVTLYISHHGYCESGKAESAGGAALLGLSSYTRWHHERWKACLEQVLINHHQRPRLSRCPGTSTCRLRSRHNKMLMS